MYKFNNSNISFDEWIRLNDIDTPQILEAADTIADQESIITEQEQEIYNLKSLINSFDFETIEKELDGIDKRADNDKDSFSLNAIELILNLYKLRIKDI